MSFGALDLFVLFLITMGPLKPAIVFTTLTADSDAGFRRRVAIKTAVTATVVTVLFAVAGEIMLSAFHVSLPALKLAGGLILVLYALGMVTGSESKGDDSTGTATSTDIGVFPLALPLLATPQGLVAIVTVTASVPGPQDLLLVIGLLVALMTFNFIFLLGAHRILGLIGPSALNVVARVVGLLLVALAIQLMIWGLTDLGVLEALPAVS